MLGLQTHRLDTEEDMGLTSAVAKTTKQYGGCRGRSRNGRWATTATSDRQVARKASVIRDWFHVLDLSRADRLDVRVNGEDEDSMLKAAVQMCGDKLGP
jgi:hypothetical protein